jgi:hypothetical protein
VIATVASPQLLLLASDMNLFPNSPIAVISQKPQETPTARRALQPFRHFLLSACGFLAAQTNLKNGPLGGDNQAGGRTCFGVSWESFPLG